MVENKYFLIWTQYTGKVNFISRDNVVNQLFGAVYHGCKTFPTKSITGIADKH